MEQKKQTILVALDIEKTGGFYRHPVMSVGFYVGDMDCNELETFKVNISVRWPMVVGDMIDYGDFEPRCWDEFWSKQPDNIVAECKNPEPVDASTAWHQVEAFLNRLETAYPADQYKIKFLTDNASFDVAAVDYALEKYCGRLPMRYSVLGKYRSIISADDMLDMLPKNARIAADNFIKTKVTHDHNCINDAKYIYWQYILAMWYANKDCAGHIIYSELANNNCC